MPAKATLSDDYIINKIVNLDIFENGSGVLKDRRHLIWLEACNVLENQIKPLNLYLRLQQDRQGVLSKIRESRGLPVMNILSSDSGDTSESSESENSSSRSDIDITKQPYICPKLSFNIEIKAAVWNTIAPESVFYKERGRTGKAYSVLKSGWTDIIYRQCWESTKLPCAYSFKRAKCYNSGNGPYVRIVGKCKECGSKLTGHCANKPKPDSNVKFCITTGDTRTIPHRLRRQLKGSSRVHTQTQLINKTANMWRCDEAQAMQYGDDIPPHLYSNTVLRKARQEGKDKALGLLNIRNPILSLQELKHNLEFSGTIREIAVDKFYCMYWSPTQVDLYKDVVKKGAPLTIDATGSIVKRLQRPNGQSGAIFLYQAVIQSFDGTIPVLQMLSEKHDANIISYWLKEWLRCGINVPKQTVTDYSLALLNAISLAFNECTLKAYVRTCLRNISNSDKQDFSPRCIIRIDIAHFIKMISNWKCFNGHASKVKDFYIRVAGLMTTCCTVESFSKMVLAVLTMALCESQDRSGLCECRRSEEFLLTSIKHFSVPEVTPDNSESFDDEDLSDHQLADFVDVLAQAESTAKKSKEYDRLNPYHLPAIVKPFLRLCHHYPLWTNIMSIATENAITTASSARSEAYFNYLKNNVLSNEGKPLRVDKFLVRHMRSIAASCNIERAEFNAVNMKEHDSFSQKCDIEKDSAEDTSPVLDELTICLNEEENWRGKNRKLKDVDIQNNSKRGKYLRPVPDIDLIHNRPHRKRREFTIQNGGSVKINSKKVYLYYTCSFDSTVELVASACADFQQYKSVVESDFKISKFYQLVLNYLNNGLTKEWYEQRALFLMTPMTSSTKGINCARNISNMIEQVMADCPSVVEEGTCNVCKHSMIKHVPIMEISSRPIVEHGLREGLQTSIDEHFANVEVACHKCQSIVKIMRTAKQHVFIDTEHAFISQLASTLGFPNAPQQVPLLAIPPILRIQDKRYHLIGTIDFHPPALIDGVGHYIAFCRRITGDWEKRDSLSTKTHNIPAKNLNTLVKPVVLLYVES